MDIRMLARNTSVAIFDNQPLMVEGITSTVRQSFDYAVVAKGTSIDDLMQAVREAHPDLVILDPDLVGLRSEMLERARFHSPNVRFIALASSRCVDTAVRVLTGPIRGYVLKDRPSEDLISAIETVMKGGLYVTPTFAADVIAALQKPATRAGRHSKVRLSRREMQIVDLLLEGRQNREIALRLGLSERTIKGYMTNLMSKLGARSRLEVVVAVQQSGGAQRLEQNA